MTDKITPPPIVGGRFHIDGEDLTNTHYEGSTIIYAGAEPPILKNTRFSKCDWQFIGAAANTMMFLHRMATLNDESREFVMKAILAGPTGGRDDGAQEGE